MLQRFLALPLVEKRLVLQAALLLTRVRWVIAREGVTRFRPALASAHSDVAFDPVQRMRARKVARLVLAARHLVPGHCTCLHLALAAQQLLADRHLAASVRIGVRKDDGEFRAHAWVQAGADVLLDVEDYDAYHVLPFLGTKPETT
jgi:hypothetical protein